MARGHDLARGYRDASWQCAMQISPYYFVPCHDMSRAMIEHGAMIAHVEREKIQMFFVPCHDMSRAMIEHVERENAAWQCPRIYN